MTKTATVELRSNAALVGHRVELLFEPFDLTRIEVRRHGTPTELVGRQSHHSEPETHATAMKPSGIDYANLIATAQAAEPAAASATAPSPAPDRSLASSTATPARMPSRDDGLADLRFLSRTVRTRTRPRHAAPAQRPQRSGCPHRLVHHRTPHRAITGEVGAALNCSPLRHLPAPTVGLRGIHCSVASLGRRPLVHHATHAPQAADGLGERGRSGVVFEEAAASATTRSKRCAAHRRRRRLVEPIRLPARRTTTLRRRMKLGVLAALYQRIGRATRCRP